MSADETSAVSNTRLKRTRGFLGGSGGSVARGAQGLRQGAGPANIQGQVLATDPNIGYLTIDMDRDVSQQVASSIAALETNIRTRILY